MNISLRVFGFGVAALVLGGCANGNGDAHPDYAAQRRDVTGSNIPTRPGSLPSDNVLANTPPDSVARDRPSLYPTDPVVGASPNGTR